MRDRHVLRVALFFLGIMFAAIAAFGAFTWNEKGAVLALMAYPAYVFLKWARAVPNERRSESALTTTRLLTDFQRSCESALLQALSSCRRSLMQRSLEGQRDTYIQARISDSDITVFIYEDEAQFHRDSGKRPGIYERPDFRSLQAADSPMRGHRGRPAPCQLLKDLGVQRDQLIGMIRADVIETDDVSQAMAAPQRFSVLARSVCGIER